MTTYVLIHGAGDSAFFWHLVVPELRMQDVHPSGSGVRAQAVAPDGALVDDFRIVETERMVHVLNAPSPGATASISIGKSIAEMAAKSFDLA